MKKCGTELIEKEIKMQTQEPGNAYEELEAHLELLHKDEEALKAFVKTSVMRND